MISGIHISSQLLHSFPTVIMLTWSPYEDFYIINYFVPLNTLLQQVNDIQSYIHKSHGVFVSNFIIIHVSYNNYPTVTLSSWPGADTRPPSPCISLTLGLVNGWAPSQI